jgi:Zn-dependent oligopeptidase
MDVLNGNKGGEENVKFFEEAVALRNEQAVLLGYSTYADYVLEVKMAKNKETVNNFLSDLRTKLLPYG